MHTYYDISMFLYLGIDIELNNGITITDQTNNAKVELFPVSGHLVKSPGRIFERMYSSSA